MPNQEFVKFESHQGESYLTVLERLHSVLKPRSYLEIGTQTGTSLQVAKCASVAIDPNFIIDSNVFQDKSECHLFQMSSDLFFKDRNPTTILGRPLDMSFLDGMHLFEFLLRDFINVEAHSSKNSIIAMHDCIPNDSHVARRDSEDLSLIDFTENPDYWAGDVWKVIAVLKKYRPHLKIVSLDAPPTGLVLVTNLDPSNDYLKKNYYSILEEAKTSNEFEFPKYMESLNLVSTHSLATPNEIFKDFWL